MAELQDTNIIGSLMLNGSPIVESEWQANGTSCVRWSDGTQICTGSTSSLVSGGAMGSIYYGDTPVNWQFLKPFFTAPYLIVLPYSSAANGATIINSRILTTPTMSGYNGNIRTFLTNSSMSFNIILQYIAIGRWK